MQSFIMSQRCEDLLFARESIAFHPAMLFVIVCLAREKLMILIFLTPWKENRVPERRR